MALAVSAMLDNVAALINDVSKITYTYAKMLPYFKIAYQEVQNRLTLLGHPALGEISAPETINAGIAEMVSLGVNSSRDIVLEPIRVYERTVGANNNSWYEMDRLDWEELREPTSVLGSWAWRQGVIKLTPATTNRQLLVYYRRILTPIVDQTTVIDHPSFRSFLEYRTAALIAAIVMKDMSRAGALDMQSSSALENSLLAAVKTMQHAPAKRRGYFFRR